MANEKVEGKTIPTTVRVPRATLDGTAEAARKAELPKGGPVIAIGPTEDGPWCPPGIADLAVEVRAERPIMKWVLLGVLLLIGAYMAAVDLLDRRGGLIDRGHQINHQLLIQNLKLQAERDLAVGLIERDQADWRKEARR